jgi:ATP-dependent RNA helicase DeaD
MTNFRSFNLPAKLLESLDRLKFVEPTPIQMATIPLALEGRDILGSAQTGTGKTAAFGIPLIAKLLSSDTGSAVVVTPTRELASQVLAALEDLLGKNSPIKTCLLIGGDSMQKQFEQLKRKPRLFVGTPGRMNDHLDRGTLRLKDVNYLVLDETDRMLDMGFSIQIDAIVKHISSDRQTLLFSATMPQNIVKAANSYMKNPERVAVGSTSAPGKNIKQEIIHLKEQEKHPRLVDELNSRKGSIIIFMKTKFGTEKMAKKLAAEGHSAIAIHGDLQHRKRERVIKAFRNKKYRVLVATDVAARGLDIPHIEHVINHDLPQCPEDYLHRIGRTARAGAEGEAICFVSGEDRRKWDAINRLMNPDAPRTAGKNDSGKSFKGKGKSRSNEGRNKFGQKPSNSNSTKKFGSGKPQRSGSGGGTGNSGGNGTGNGGKRKSFGGGGRRTAA